MLKLRAHAAELAEALCGAGGYEPPEEASDAISYLQLCSGVKDINFNTFEWDRTAGWCEPADDYRDEHDRLRKALTHRLTLFLFCWAALESFASRLPINSVKVTGRKSPGKIERLCAFLTEKYHEPILKEWESTLYCLRCTIGRSSHNKLGLLAGKSPAFVGPPAEGIHLVYKLRNAFAHGSFTVPEPTRDEKAPETHPDVAVIAISTRVVLLTIQMLALCHFALDQRLELPMRLENDEEYLTVANYFPYLHLESAPQEEANPPGT